MSRKIVESSSSEENEEENEEELVESTDLKFSIKQGGRGGSTANSSKLDLSVGKSTSSEIEVCPNQKLIETNLFKTPNQV